MKEQSLRHPVIRTLTTVIVGMISVTGVRAETGFGIVANSQAVQEVMSGTRAEANVAWWGFDADDSTRFLQAAIDSGARKVIVPYRGAPWIITPVKLRSDLELVFEPGVLVLAKKGSFHGGNDSLFAAVDAHDVTVRGYGAMLRMRKQDYESEAY